MGNKEIFEKYRRIYSEKSNDISKRKSYASRSKYKQIMEYKYDHLDAVTDAPGLFCKDMYFECLDYGGKIGHILSIFTKFYDVRDFYMDKRNNIFADIRLFMNIENEFSKYKKYNYYW